MVELKVKIDDKEMDYDEARKLFYALKRIFEPTQVVMPPYTPSPNVWPTFTTYEVYPVTC